MISAEHKPVLHLLLNEILQDSHDYAMCSAKDHYMRVRPFVVYKDPTCTPEQDNKMGYYAGTPVWGFVPEPPIRTSQPAGTHTAVINADGQQVVWSGGTATGTTINPLGWQSIEEGGVATGTLIHSGGRQTIEENGMARNTTIEGGIQHIRE